MTVLVAPTLRRTAILAIAGTMSAGPALGADDQWHFWVTPYLWLPTMSSNVSTLLPRPGGPSGIEPRLVSVSAEADPSGYLDDLQMAVMLTAGASRGRWSLLTDIVYTDFANQKTKVRHAIDPDRQLPVAISRQASWDLSATLWTLAAGYKVIDDPSWDLDLIAGMRYLRLASDLKVSFLDPSGRYLSSGKISLDQSDWDGIIGLRGRVSIQGTDWFVPFYADVGTGDSELTWQAMLGIGYRFGWGETTLAWRALGYEFNRNDMDLTMSGPGLGVSFRW